MAPFPMEQELQDRREIHAWEIQTPRFRQVLNDPPQRAQMDFLKQGPGLICCYSLKNSRFPEFTSARRAVRVRLESKGGGLRRAGTYGSPAALTPHKRLWAAGATGGPTRAEPTRARNSWRNEQRQTRPRAASRAEGAAVAAADRSRAQACAQRSQRRATRPVVGCPSSSAAGRTRR